MKKWGLNAVRIPIGFWAYDNAGTPHLSGADVYLERMIGWCREVGLWVLVDCHGSPGSQNGFDNSGRSGEALWQTGDNLYQNQVEADKSLTQPEHIAKACNWTQTNLLPRNSSLPVIVGEFSAATDICANPDGSTVAGTTCSIDGCQCADNVDIQWWNQPLKDVTRQFFEAELEAFEKGAQGWFVWSWKGPGGWGMENLIQNGVVGQSVHDRKFGKQCY
jgi:glucan 1,3-beta-glucosidase